MTASILTCINSNCQLLVCNFANLGRTEPSFWGGHKMLLSYNSKTGWKVVQLNIFQRFLRDYLGFYKETRFDNVYEAWRKEKKVHADLKKDHPINKYMKAIWQKRYLIALGNSSLADAKVFCFAETHGDIKFRKTIAKIIEAHYRPGDIILIEGGRAGKIYQRENDLEKPDIVPEVVSSTLKNIFERITAIFWSPEQTQIKKVKVPSNDKWTIYMKGKYNVQGWEPDGIKKLQKELFGLTKEKYAQLLQLNKEILANIPKTDAYTPKEIASLEESFKKLNNDYTHLAEYFLIKPKEIEKQLKVMNGCLQDLKNKNEEINVNVFRALISIYFTEIEKNYEKASYHYLKNKDLVKKIYDTIIDRNKAMCQEIYKYRQLGKKVFVIGGTAHFLTHSAKRTKDLAETKACLQKQPHLIVTKREDYKKNRLTLFNPELKEVALGGWYAHLK